MLYFLSSQVFITKKMIFTIISSFGSELPIDLLMRIVPIYLILFLLYYFIPSICLWQVFKKAGKTPWFALIPFVCFITLLEITKKPKAWFIGLFFPFIIYVLYFIVYIELAKRFEKNTRFGVAMTICPFIFLPILAFGDAHYLGQKEKFYDDEILDRG